MKTLNRSGSDKKIQWIAKDTSSDNVTKTVLRFKDLELEFFVRRCELINLLYIL